MIENYKLTEYSRGGGCGCKIAPAVLDEILTGSKSQIQFNNLLVGNESADDAAVMKLNDETAIISTTDFFLPIVDSAFDFGRIAACNAISDIYAMGGKPILALALLGWPIDKLPIQLASEVLRGARTICDSISIPIAGGHTIDSIEPIFGLSVNGIVHPKIIIQNNTALAGDFLFVTKPLGTGIISSALKKNKCNDETLKAAVDVMTTLNSFGEKLSGLTYVHAMTDITGFGFIGHLNEMCDKNRISIDVYYNAIKIIEGVKEFAKQFIYPDNTMRNWKAYEKSVEGINGESLLMLCDPQTNGGLMIAVSESHLKDFKILLSQNNLTDFIEPVGKFMPAKEKNIYINY